MSGTATYVYCVVRSPRRPGPGRVPSGVPGAAAVGMLDAGRSLWLAASDVPLDTYGPRPLEAALRDMQWVSDVAVSHEAVVEHFARKRGTTVVPLKLFTMFSTDQRAIEEMASRRREIDAIARRIAGCEEWGVRVSRAAADAHSTRGPVRAATGAAFLAAKKQVRDDARAASRAAAESAERVYATLGAIAREARRRSGEPSGADAPPLLDAAFLVPASRKRQFRAAARQSAGQCARAGATMTLTGPWPAYNFVQRPEASR